MSASLNLLGWALDFATIAVGLALVLCGWRLLRGPEAPDRVLALDTMYINALALVILLGMRWQMDLLFEAALIIALLGFASTVALARYLSRGDVME
ncbi:K+/H+ antiporter subunit F [Kinneretia asaccharophila]|jgi:multicomponent K+:H+ antiporter subunit F|uniref:Multisubunit potassium/proton antiporter PhaF subunit n=1 Tax=Roseateles asaccharophilus TaxID=582607 RepID=A0A4R6N952_9BURK|nr:K+/H+ antiporter subunit F [Roseateles asaccharophilus]MDN3543704.1 K+/H+ antiporter subunit F [Roseateles asaccharophilus]TDP11918.1 multisubunit potassium/proton antiporter PhaF subunit [Roseateles asaccharophilus]